MKRLLYWIDHQFLGIAALLCLLIGMLFSSAMMSIGMIALTANWVFNLNFKWRTKQFIQHPVLVGLCLFFIAMALGGLYSDNFLYWVDRMRMKLPFLLMPAAILSIPYFDKKVYHSLLYVFFFMIAAVCLYLMGWYLFHFQEMTEAYKQGHVLPTPVEHIRFSLMVVYAAVIGLYFWMSNWQYRFSWEKPLQLGLGLFLVLFIHVLAVRSGLVALYGVFLYFLVYAAFKYRNWLKLSLTVVLVGAAMFLAYQTIPSLKNKMDYSFYNLYNIKHNLDIKNLSDSHRVATIKAGLDMGCQSPIIGVGYGDVKEKTENYLQANYPAVAGSGFLPQSQYVLIFAAAGMLGLLLFVVVTMLPFFYQKGWSMPLMGGFLAIVLPSFLIEQTLETQLGTAFYMTFLLMAIRYQFEEKPHHP